MESVLTRGTIVSFAMGTELQKGVIISNNTCLLHSSVFQVYPIKENSFDGIEEKEMIVSSQQLVSVVGKMQKKKMAQVNKAILKRHKVLEEFQSFSPQKLVGGIYYVNLPEQTDTSIQSGKRPVLVVSEEKDGYINVIPLTTRKKKFLPTHVLLRQEEFDFLLNSTVLAESEMTIKIEELGEFKGSLNKEKLLSVLNAIKIQHGIS